jgi:TolB protein
MNVHIAFRLVCLSQILLCGCPGSTPSDHYRPPGHGDISIAVSPNDDAILFNASGTGGRDLYLLNLVDQKVTKILDSSDYETTPCFSPDGLRVVYAAGVKGDRADHIFSMRLDGTDKKQLTDIDANDTSPAFSPDGTKIVFARDKTYQWGGLAANWEPGGVVCTMDADGGNARQLTADGGFAFNPRFTTDGTRVAYSTETGRMSVSVDGSDSPAQLGGPSGAIASPDGMSIACTEGKFSGDLRVVIADSDAGSPRIVTPQVSGCYSPTFAHRSERLYFLLEEWPNGPTGTPSFSLWECSSKGGKEKMIADRSLFDDPLHWKP